MTEKKDHKKNELAMRRYLVLAILLGLFALLCAGKLFYTTVVMADRWEEKGAGSRYGLAVIQPERGSIMASDGELLAVNVRFYNVLLDMGSNALDVSEFRKNLSALCDSLAAFRRGGKSAEEWKTLLEAELAKPQAKRTHRLMLFRDCSSAEYVQIRNYPYFEGRSRNVLYSTPVVERLRPYGIMAARSIGSVRWNEATGECHGRSGMEMSLDSLLYGTPGLAKKVQFVNTIALWDSVSPVRGYDVKTTIDIDIQDMLEDELMKMCKFAKANWGTAVLMEVKTGDIKAISNLQLDTVDGSYWEQVNHAMRGYEPGSVIKPISMLIALEDNLVRLDERIPTGKRFPYPASRPITDSHSYESLTPAGVIACSSNIGMTKIILRGFEQNPGRFYTRIKQIGMLDPLNTGIAGECPPRIDSLPSTPGGRIDLTRTCYGYRTLIPPIYTLAMYNAIANDGRFVRPRLVKELWRDGKCDSVIPVSYVRDRICSPQTAAALRDMLTGVVWSKGGTARVLRNNFVKIAGKTGTAYDIVDGHYDYRKKRVAFCGFFPADNPMYTCIVVMQGGNRGASYSSGTVLMNTALRMYAHGMLGNKSDYRTELDNHKNPPLLFHTDDVEREAIVEGLDGQNVRMLVQRPVATGVPSVLNMGLRDAVARIESCGLIVGQVEGTGFVFRQEPEAGSPIRKGERVRLYLRNMN